MLALMITLYAIGIVILGCGSAILISMQIARKSAAPFFPSTKRIARLALKEAGAKPGAIFYDLGAGTGTSIVVADKDFGMHAIGSEISILPYGIAKLKIAFRHSKAQMRFENLFKQDISDADIVFCYLAERVLPRLVLKFKKELKPGAQIISYAFPLPGLTPEKTAAPYEGAWKLYFYRM